MDDFRDVSPLKALKGMTVLSLASGNELGRVRDLFVDPVNGVLLGLSLDAAEEGMVAGLPCDLIYSFGRDAVMVQADDSIAAFETTKLAGSPNAQGLFGTEVITESGHVLGKITNVFVTLRPPPLVLYEIRQSLLDKLLGREFFIPASAGHALSDDAARLVVPDVTAETAASDLMALVDRTVAVGTFSPPGSTVVSPTDDDDETVTRHDEDETVVSGRDEDETILRRPEATK